MRALIIHRKPGWYGRARKLKLFVDGDAAGSIKTGETLTINIPDGAQTIYGKMDWGKTEPFSIETAKSGDKLVIISRFTLNPLKNIAIQAIPVRFEYDA